MDFSRLTSLRTLLSLLCLAAPAVAQLPTVPPIKTPAPPAATTPAAGKAGEQGGESKSASGAAERQSATGTHTRLSPLDPAPPPPRVASRPRIGLALGGGGALGLTEIGALQWFEENHIPVDEIAGTSMGCLISSLYATGRSPKQMSQVVNDRVFTQVFSFSGSYTSRSFRRREESRELPNGITIGLKHGVSFRNAVLIDQGLNAFLDREFLRYDDRTDFNTLPIPLRCVSTDLNDAVPVVFARGSIPDAVRASVSIPGIFPPFEMNGHEYVDGVVLENLPTPALREMKPDVVLAVSLPLAPVAAGQLGSIIGVFGRAFSVATEAAEVQDRKLADLVIIPDITGYTVTDYFKSADLESRGYRAAEEHRAALMKYALSDAEWAAYTAHRTSLIRGPAAPVLRVRVTAPDHSSTLVVQRLFAPLINQPVDTAKIEALLDEIRSDGAYDADYTVGYESQQQFENHAAATLPGTIDVPVTTTVPDAAVVSAGTPTPEPGAAMPKPGTAPTSNQPRSTDETRANEPVVAARPGAPGFAATQEATADSMAAIPNRPIILVNVTRRKTGPPFVILGANIEAQTNAFTRATVEGVVLDQDFGGYGSELRSRIKVGYETYLGSEYFRPLNALAPREHTLFVAPHIDFLRHPYPMFTGPNQVADRQLQRFDLGADLGWTNMRTQQLRAGYEWAQLHWNITTGSDGSPDFSGQSQRVHLLYDFDTQDRALVPQFGVHLSTEAAYLFHSVNSPDSPELSGRFSVAHRFSLHKAPPKDAPKDPNRGHEVFVFATEGGTTFDRNVAEPFRFAIGGPLRLSASAIDQYRGTDYWLVEPAILRRIASLPQPLGQSIYLGFGIEAAQIRAPGVPVINRQDAFIGVVAETPLGVITLAPAIGSNGERKLVFTLGKLF